MILLSLFYPESEIPGCTYSLAISVGMHPIHLQSRVLRFYVLWCLTNSGLTTFEIPDGANERRVLMHRVDVTTRYILLWESQLCPIKGDK